MPDDDSWWTRRMTIGTAVVTGIGLLGTVIGLAVDVPALWAGRASAPITFGLRDGDVIDRCTRFSGSAPDVAGKVLMAAHHSHYDQYYFQRPEREEDGSWQMRITIGPASTPAEIHYAVQLFFVTEAEARFLTGIAGDSGRGFAKSLPPDATQTTTLTVLRRKESNAAPCA